MDKEKLRQIINKEWHLPFADKVGGVIKSFSLTEKTVFVFFSLLLTISGLTLLFQVNKLFLVEVPDYGGTLTEGIIGTPRFINPLLATSDIDKDLTSLIYSGLLKTSSSGELVPDLAESFTVSPDSLTYTFVLKDDLYFHDGKKITVDDVIFSIEKTQDPLLKSPREANWSGVKISKIDDKTVSFTLGQPYSPFITKIVIKSYSNERDQVDAYRDGSIDSLHSMSPKELPLVKLEDDQVILSPLPRIFGVFFNQNVAPIFVNKEVRSALDIATDKKAIVDKVLGGYGEVIDKPVPVKYITTETGTTTPEERIEKAQALLIKNGWKLNSDGIFTKADKKSTTTLSFSISTGNAPELKEAAYLLQAQWRKMGAEVEVKIFEIGDLNQNIIKPRKYDSLLFGEIIGRDMDLYPFWHSSQRNTPGLNIALYTNLKADRILESIRKTTNPDVQKSNFEQFNKEIKNDIPAVFTYSPYFIYIIPKTVRNVKPVVLTEPKERWSEISLWYIETNNVWQIFNK